MTAVNTMTEKEYPEDVKELRAQDPRVAEELAAFTGVGQVLDWMQQRRLDLKAIVIVSQDEFSYDLLLPLEPGGRWLSFGVT